MAFIENYFVEINIVNLQCSLKKKRKFYQEGKVQKSTNGNISFRKDATRRI